ncbi:hypothetical protein DPMN_024028 [Dreissena polymorpha]|uniref:Uncharacterized protein n=1 Tax=Dreissena polymorpha TaxID=45954 RepID=A0A9D4LN53_DREPO|nr:hypothetical protein DPMN_024028 [Dreissena polymorpha]
MPSDSKQSPKPVFFHHCCCREINTNKTDGTDNRISSNTENVKICHITKAVFTEDHLITSRLH